VDLRRRLEPVSETLQELELAANLRPDEALTLFSTEGFSGAIHLRGYVAEIELKPRFFLAGRKTDDQAAVFRRRAELIAKQQNLSGHFQQADRGHHIWFWSWLIWRVPNAQGEQLRFELRNGLCRHTLRVAGIW
jgi:hypothetical protein